MLNSIELVATVKTVYRFKFTCVCMPVYMHGFSSAIFSAQFVRELPYALKLANLASLCDQSAPRIFLSPFPSTRITIVHLWAVVALLCMLGTWAQMCMLCDMCVTGWVIFPALGSKLLQWGYSQLPENRLITGVCDVSEPTGEQPFFAVTTGSCLSMLGSPSTFQS